VAFFVLKLNGHEHLKMDNRLIFKEKALFCSTFSAFSLIYASSKRVVFLLEIYTNLTQILLNLCEKKRRKITFALWKSKGYDCFQGQAQPVLRLK